MFSNNPGVFALGAALIVYAILSPKPAQKHIHLNK